MPTSELTILEFVNAFYAGLVFAIWLNYYSDGYYGGIWD